MTSVFEIDGSLLGGGGQILRVALSLSCLRQVPVRIYNIRAGRPKPGLMEQHLKGVELLRKMCNAHVTGLHPGSCDLTFKPTKIKGGFYECFINTAGSISLILQVAIPCAIFADCPVKLRITGGTNVDMAPQVDYLTEVFRPVLEKFGATFDFELVRRGYYPRGGGEVIIKIRPIQHLTGIDLTKFGNIVSINGWSFSSGTLPPCVSTRIADGVKETLSNFKNINIECYKEDEIIAPHSASGIILVAETDTGCVIGASGLGKKKEKLEVTGKKAALDLLKSIEQEACVDDYCQDQIVIFMAIAKGPSKVKIGGLTQHTKTAIFVVEILAKVQFNVVPIQGGNIVHCTGS
ncbi:RNA 3'-terminal phosphate cyclase [Rhynchophorus ferrugineus]|uniref:RNA 3'-terminal phosphate cyclase n=1 Tax=Rhynchophorus ferrugineus TaxID=354439 RepID=UPI003FCC7DF0